jgi:hypothetical protein
VFYEHGKCYFVGCDAVVFGSNASTFRRNILPLFSRPNRNIPNNVSVTSKQKRGGSALVQDICEILPDCVGSHPRSHQHQERCVAIRGNTTSYHCAELGSGLQRLVTNDERNGHGLTTVKEEITSNPGQGSSYPQISLVSSIIQATFHRI